VAAVVAWGECGVSVCSEMVVEGLRPLAPTPLLYLQRHGRGAALDRRPAARCHQLSLSAIVTGDERET